MIHMASGASGKSTEDESHETARKDILEMLAKYSAPAGPGEPADRAHLERALEELNESKKRQRKKRLTQTRVLGITIAATTFDVMVAADLRYPILLLDEASQMVEPASMQPIVRFKAERLLAVGGEMHHAHEETKGAREDEACPRMRCDCSLCCLTHESRLCLLVPRRSKAATAYAARQ
jgi:hypothetical protein